MFGIEREYKFKTIDDNSKMFFVTKIRSATLATKIWRLCRSLVNARGASYCLVFRAIFIKTIGVNLVVNYSQFKIYLLFCPYECNKLHWWAKQNKIFILGIRNPLCRERGLKV